MTSTHPLRPPVGVQLPPASGESPSISPLSLNQITRDYFSQYDAAAIAQYAPLANDPCYQPKFYVAPDTNSQVMQPGQYVPYGMQITPGSLIYGFYLPAQFATSEPAQYLVQITDASLQHDWYDEPIPSFFLGNYKPTCLSNVKAQLSSFPNLLCAPYPVVGSGLFLVKFWNGPVAQRIQLVFGVLEAVG
jgi:hypothetical protein